ncbi:hypothetical protein chiPu_0026454, partial [Chiloscyllium punctatum]|nr:hypothetical protein [Chiloscyllium punctatum]
IGRSLKKGSPGSEIKPNGWNTCSSVCEQNTRIITTKKMESGRVPAGSHRYHGV